MRSTRQATRRTATRQEILDTARAQMAAQGAAALSLRAIARQMQLTAPALYRYFADRDALVTALIIDAFNALADSLAAARDARPETSLGQRLLAMALAYRDWARAHPQDYLLIFGTPIPGYAAPAEATGLAAKRCFDVLAEALLPAGGPRARLARDYAAAPSGIQAQVAAWRTNYGYAVGGAGLWFALTAWTRMHGLVSLELVGQLEPFFGDAGALYRWEMIRLIEAAGLRPEPNAPAQGD